MKRLKFSKINFIIARLVHNHSSHCWYVAELTANSGLCFLNHSTVSVQLRKYKKNWDQRHCKLSSLLTSPDEKKENQKLASQILITITEINISFFVAFVSLSYSRLDFLHPFYYVFCEKIKDRWSCEQDCGAGSVHHAGELWQVFAVLTVLIHKVRALNMLQLFCSNKLCFDTIAL